MVGGHARDGEGYFFEPTVLSDVPDDARLLKEEIFGPVAPVASFSDEDEAIAAANDTEFGLVAYFYTRDLKRALRVGRAAGHRHGRRQPGDRLEPGRAVRRASSTPASVAKAVREGIDEYLETKYLAIAT